MKILQRLLDNKTGIIFVISHWILLIFLLPFLVDMRGDINWKVCLALTVVMSDLPALAITAILWLPFYIFPEDTTIFSYGVISTSFLAITLQWLFIGRCFSNIFNPSESKPMTLSLTDE